MKSWMLVLAIVILGGCGKAKPEAGRPASGTGGTRTGGAGGAPTGMGGGGGAFGGSDALDAGTDDTDAAPADGGAGTDAVDAGTVDTDAAPADGGAGTDAVDAGTDGTDAGAADGDADPGVPAPACDGMLPACVLPVASYARDVAPILNAKCNNCHSPEPDKPWPLDTYPNVVVWADLVIESLTHCTMPPTDGGTPSLTPAEHQAIANWLACDAPDN